MAKHRIYTMEFGKVYPAYVNKATKKGHTQEEVDEIIEWLFGYDKAALQAEIDKGTNIETFVESAPALNPLRDHIKGVVCGVRVEEVEERVMREVRYLDKLIDELARGKAMEKILRTG